MHYDPINYWCKHAPNGRVQSSDFGIFTKGFKLDKYYCRCQMCKYSGWRSPSRLALTNYLVNGEV